VTDTRESDFSSDYYYVQYNRQEKIHRKDRLSMTEHDEVEKRAEKTETNCDLGCCHPPVSHGLV